MSASLDVDWGNTGSKAIDAELFTTLTPTLFAGKGFGFLPDDLKYLKPLAITGQVGYAVPTQSATASLDEAESAGYNPQPTISRLGRVHSIQHAVPQIGG